MLPVRPLPLPDESIAGYLVRVVERNGMESWQSILTYAKVHPDQRTFAWLLTDHGRLPQLAAAIGVGLDVIAPILYRPVPNLTKVREVYWHAQRIPTTYLRLMHAPVCPECLRESPHLRQAWDFKFVAACPRHRRLLLAQCPECGAKIARNRASVTLCPCGADLTAPSAPTKDVDAATWVVKVSTEPPGMHPETELAQFAALTSVWTNEALLEAPPGIADETALDLVNAGANQALAALRSTKGGEALKALLGRRKARWPTLGAAAAALPLFGLADEGASPWSSTDIKAVVDGTYPTKGVEPHRLSDLQVSAWATARLLGLSRNGLASAAAMGALPAIITGQGKRSHERYFMATSISEILSRLAPTPSAEPMAHARRALGRQFSLAGILDGISQRKLQVLQFNPLHGLGEAEIAWIPTPRKAGHALSVAELASRWDVHPENIYGLLRHGLLPARATNVGQRVDAEVAASFAKQYIFPRELAREHGANAFTVARKLVKLGVVPAFSPLTNGSTVYVFRRTDVARLTWEQIDQTRGLGIRSRKRSPAIRRKEIPTGLLTAREAAEEFGLSLQQLASLARQGMLIRHAAPIDPHHARFFNQSDVRKYLAKYRDNPDLIRLEDAAKAVGESIFEFTMRWPQAGFATVVDSGIDRHISRSDLARVQAAKLAFLSVEEAATELGTDRQSVANWIRSGWVQAAHGPTIDGTKRYLLERTVVAALKKCIAESPASRFAFLSGLGLKRQRRLTLPRGNRSVQIDKRDGQ